MGKSKIEVLDGGWTPEVLLHQVLEHKPTRIFVMFETDDGQWSHASCNLSPADIHLCCGVMQHEIVASEM